MSDKYKFGQWYSVKDIKNEMPEEYDWVLVSVVDYHDPKVRLVPQVAELRNGKWMSLEDCEGNLEAWYHVKVTHWMPLPDAPNDADDCI